MGDEKEKPKDERAAERQMTERELNFRDMREIQYLDHRFALDLQQAFVSTQKRALEDQDRRKCWIETCTASLEVHGGQNIQMDRAEAIARRAVEVADRVLEMYEERFS